MNNYENAGVGLKNMYVVTIGSFVCALLSPFLGVLSTVGLLIFYIINLIGYFYVGKDLIAGKIAFVLQIVLIVMSGISCLLLSKGWLIILVEELIPPVVVCLVYISVIRVLLQKGSGKVAKQGVAALCLQLLNEGIVYLATYMVREEKILPALLILFGFSAVRLFSVLRFLKKGAKEFGVVF